MQKKEENCTHFSRIFFHKNKFSKTNKQSLGDAKFFIFEK